MKASAISLFRIVRTLLTIALACVGVVALLNWFALPKLRAENRPPDYMKETVTPDGKMKAVLFTYAGGGAFAPYCFNRLAIVPADVKNEDAVAPRYEIYRTDCRSFANHELSPKLDWVSSSGLKITASIRESFKYPQSISIKGWDETRTVKIELSTQD